MSHHWRDLLMLNTLRPPVVNMQIFIRIRISILHVVQSADPHYTRSRQGWRYLNSGGLPGQRIWEAKG